MSAIVEAEQPYRYTDDDGSEVSFKEGERFILLAKSSVDWWKVQRTGLFAGKSVCYVPAAYVKEVNVTPRGHHTKQYVNLEVYQKIIQKDHEGLSRLQNKRMVVSKTLSQDSPTDVRRPYLDEYGSNEDLEHSVSCSFSGFFSQKEAQWCM